MEMRDREIIELPEYTEDDLEKLISLMLDPNSDLRYNETRYGNSLEEVHFIRGPVRNEKFKLTRDGVMVSFPDKEIYALLSGYESALIPFRNDLLLELFEIIFKVPFKDMALFEKRFPEIYKWRMSIQK